MNDNSSRVMDIDINEILPNRFQPRIQFDEEEILELSDSIKEHGVIQPIVVRTIGDKYEIIAGERRYKASVLAGKETVPVIVKNLNDRDSAEIALIENVQRKNLTPIEEALSYKKILDMGYMTQESLASKLGKSQSAVANKIRLLNLSDDVQEALLENKISERHARSLLRLESSELQNKMLKRIISERLTVRKTDEEIDKIKNEPESDDGSQKVIEKGEINMNNNMNMMPNMTPNTNPTGGFDIFGSPEPVEQPVNSFVSAPVQPTYDVGNNLAMNAAPVTEINNVGVMQPTMPVVGPQPINPVEQSLDTPQAMETSGKTDSMFGLNQYNLNAPISTDVTNNSSVSEVIPNIPSIPIMPTMNEIQFESNGTVVGAPNSVSQVQEVSQFNLNPTQSVPTIEQPVTQQETSTGFQFDENGMVVSAPSTPEQPSVPVTTPIIENPVQPQPTEQPPIVPDFNSTFSFGNSSESNSNSISMDNTNYTQPEEIKMPEPIIITDYNKQYDPVMPQSQQMVQQKVDFREVINAIRECSAKIEQYGYKIDVEEYDLSNMYQVIFKIEK